MSEQSYEQRVAARLRQEYSELEDPVVKAQMQLDRWQQAQRDEAAEDRRLMRELNPTGLKIW